MSETLIIVAIALAVVPMLLVIAPEAREWDDLARRLRRFQLRHLMLGVAAAAWVFWLFTTNLVAWPLLMAGVVLLVRFLRIWRDEVVHLMGRGEGEFPGRQDRVVWLLILIFLGPLGVWFFRGYRLAHWPEPAPEPESGFSPSGAAVPSSG